ncbi:MULTISPECIES: DUF1254 domain-containing protein [unclassified Pseudofrankia]|uniref:DUF1254 domain-containing protein n=1 Tax=unclassified Pseudofrankia TaxID=2994372 RepID=UPI0008DA8A66|nr:MULTISPECIES: DUF1254 domain-containing protein [unclassified Pseudofrankia]MDT3446136.1 DUF1254 domain-containing protein [Pseudofrankia sp. BMG5.37]OHV62265.1 hypothetical protein BCD48_39355 [Pseudofrankia sp. BMG5.36]
MSLPPRSLDRRHFGVLGLLAGASALGATASGCSGGSGGTDAAPTPSERAQPRSAAQVALDGAVYGYAGVTMTRTRASLVCLVGANNLVHQLELATPTARRVVAPNVDTLYSSAWLDLRAGPFVLTVPEITDRYFSYQFLDVYSNTFANIGTRATGGRSGRWAVVPPGWTGELAGQATGEVTVIDAPTWDVWLVGRTLVRGPSDLAAAKIAQRSFQLAPAQPAGATTGGGTVTPATVPPPLPAPDCDHPSDPQEPTDGGAAFFDELAALLLSDPPPAADRPVVNALVTIGVTPGSTPSRNPDRTVVAMLARAAQDAEATVTRAVDDIGEPAGTWTASYGFGKYGTDYLTRAAVAAGLLAANVQEEAIYYGTRSDSTGKPLSGAASYQLHFPADHLPPAGPGGFWSLTMYGEDNFLVDNRARVYAVGDRTEGLAVGADGSLDIYVSATQPAGPTANWLPASATGGFNLLLRVYLPTAAATGRHWAPPPVTRVNG